MDMHVFISPKVTEPMPLLDFYRRLVRAGVVNAQGLARGYDKDRNPAALDSDELHKIRDRFMIEKSDNLAGCVLVVDLVWDLGEGFYLKSLEDSLKLAAKIQCEARGEDGGLITMGLARRKLASRRRAVLPDGKIAGLTPLLDRRPAKSSSKAKKESMTVGAFVKSLNLPPDPLYEYFARLSEEEQDELIRTIKEWCRSFDEDFVSIECVACGKQIPYPKAGFAERLRAGGLRETPDFNKVGLDGCLLCLAQGTGPWIVVD
jgi:hypothetical protein